MEFTRAPHRAHHDLPLTQNAALLIDFDNVTMGIRSNLGQELRNLLESDVIRGKVAVQRAYADWRRYPQYIVPLSEASIDLIFAPAYGSSKKNATDIRLAIDALELVFTRPEIGTFILLSGDSDFSSLVLKLKEYGKYVIGVGLQESTSDILVQNCDEYYSYNQVSGLISADETGTQKHDPWVLVEKAIKRMKERGDVMRSDRLKQVMLEIDPSFDEKSAGFTKFNRFLTEAAHRDLIRLRKGESGQYEVAPGDGTAGGTESAEPVEPPASRSSRSRGRRGGRSGRSRDREDRGPRREVSEPAAVEPEESTGMAPESLTGEESARDHRSERPGGQRGRRQRGREAGEGGKFEGEVPAVALQKAYQALARVVEDLYDGKHPVRDSMTKRKLLAQDPSFDEGSLGFRKFSRFLRQAHDEGIVDMEQGEDGNFYLTPARGEDAHPAARRSRERDADRPAARGRQEARDDRTAAPETPSSPAVSGVDRAEEASPLPEGAREEESPLAAARAAAKRTLGRFRRGSKTAPPGKGERSGAIGPVDSVSPSGGRGSETSRDAKAAGSAGPGDETVSGPEAREPKPEAPPARPPVREPKPEAPAAREPVREPKPEAPPARPPARPATGGAADAGEAAAGAGARPRGLGRYRQGSRGRSPAAKPASGGTAPRIGPVPLEELKGSAPGGGAASGTDRQPREGSADHGAAGPGGGGRAEPAADARRDTGPSDPEERQAVEHMVRHWAGVGKRTAEALVEHFGARVLEVIDSEPGRLTEVLSEGRARAVIAAREGERDQ